MMGGTPDDGVGGAPIPYGDGWACTWQKEASVARRRRRRKNIGDQIVLSLILVALVWAFAPGVGWDLLGLRSRLGWPPMRRRGGAILPA